MITVYTDGGSRGNPGPAGTGVVIKDGDTVLEAFGAYLGIKTNNQAEYEALLAGLERAAKHTDDQLAVVMDSELIIRQMNGQYKVKSPELKKLHHQAKALCENFKNVAFSHTLREGNTQADALVNRAIDAREAVAGL